MTEAGTIYGVILALLFAVAAGLVGSFALMKRMILAADVISHVALPGRRLANNISHFLLASSLVSVLAVGIGFLLNAYVFHCISVAPTIVMVSALLFGLSLIRSTT
jgi:ABC-type Mn2+/Zn2+ transport system permease subunit